MQQVAAAGATAQQAGQGIDALANAGAGMQQTGGTARQAA
jgi:hypothetical protein